MIESRKKGEGDPPPPQTTNSSDARLAIAKLGNYQLWNFKMEMLLSKDDLWEVVIQDRLAGNSENWESRNGQAKACLPAEDGQLIHIRKEDTAKVRWTAFQRPHECTDLNSNLYLLSKLYGLRLQRGQETQEHVNCILKRMETLEGIGKEVKDSHAVALLLC